MQRRRPNLAARAPAVNLLICCKSPVLVYCKPPVLLQTSCTAAKLLYCCKPLVRLQTSCTAAKLLHRYISMQIQHCRRFNILCVSADTADSKQMIMLKKAYKQSWLFKADKQPWKCTIKAIQARTLIEASDGRCADASSAQHDHKPRETWQRTTIAFAAFQQQTETGGREALGLAVAWPTAKDKNMPCRLAGNEVTTVLRENM